MKDWKRKVVNSCDFFIRIVMMLTTVIILINLFSITKRVEIVIIALLYTLAIIVSAVINLSEVKTK